MSSIFTLREVKSSGRKWIDVSTDGVEVATFYSDSPAGRLVYERFIQAQLDAKCLLIHKSGV